jgi:hypothetical protein
MTDSEREEFVYDLANHYVQGTSNAGLIAMAIDRMCEILLKYSDEELRKIAPPALVQISARKKELRNREKPKGF